MSNKDEIVEWLKANKLKKDQMYRAPAELLGHYCALDAEAAYQLFNVFSEIISNNWVSWGQELSEYHQKEFLPMVKLLAQQNLRGIRVDLNQLQKYHDVLSNDIMNKADEFKRLPEVIEWTELKTEQLKEEWIKSEPTKEKKDGTVTARWKTWSEKEGSFSYDFNLNSKPQLDEFFYEFLKYEPPMVWDPKQRKEVPKLTSTGRRSLDKKALPALGDAGKLLNEYNLMVKELGYVTAYLNNTEFDTLHLGFKAPGTLTGRLAGSGGINLQQIPKSSKFLSCLKARPGYRIVQLDFCYPKGVELLTKSSRNFIEI